MHLEATSITVFGARPREIRMIGQLKLCSMRLEFLIASGNKSGLLDGTETTSWQCAQQSQRCGNDPAAGGGDECNHASGSLGMIIRASPRGKGPFRGNTLVVICQGSTHSELP